MSKISFNINGKLFEVDGKYGPDVSLNEFIRNVADFRGTKAMCHEGGCGACVVAVRAPLPPNNEVKLFSVNSCLVSVLSCHGWEVTTVEGVGNRTTGYHDIQARLAKFNGTQCGYCTPGWIMNMYSLYESKNKNLSMKEIENSFASNICRCTGYRSIADAFKSFATDVDDRLKNKLIDLEDLDFVKPCGVNCKTKCQHKCDKKDLRHKSENKEAEDWFVVDDASKIVIDCGSTKFYKVYNLNDVFKAMERNGEYRLIAGNTGQGVFHVSSYPPTVIDIFNVAVLKGHSMDINLILGAGMPLTEMMELFLKISGENEDFSYLKQFYDHMDLVAHIPVRNIGTIGGNLFMKHTNNDFQSDLFLLFETVGATLTIAEAPNKKRTVSLPDFLKLDMNRKLIMNVMLPPLSRFCSIKTYKIMPRSQNAHAVVNAGFLFHFKQNSNILEKAFIVYGSISPKFIHAEKTEAMLAGKDPYTDETLQMVLKSLAEELTPEEAPPEPSASYRKMLALALYYKAILSLCPDDKLNPKYRSGAEAIKRHTSQGNQIFDTDKSVWPLNQPVPKLEALQQCSGEATFANDLTKQPDEVFAAFVTADARPGSVISGFDASDALKLTGVIAFYSAKDIPGDNSFTPTNIPLISNDEEILCSQKVLFYGQPAGIIVAVREKIANKAAKMVKVLYSSESKDKPILTASDVLKSPQKDQRLVNNKTREPTETGKDVNCVIYGDINFESQYHYTMEPQTCVVKPTEDGMEVYSASQWLDLPNVAIAQCLKISANKINVIVRRVGGAYGSKISRQCQIACAAALVSHLQGKTCRFVMSIEDNMRVVGKRVPTYCNFEIGVNKEGEIQYLKNKFYQDNGCSSNETLSPITLNHFLSCYDTKRWYIEANSVATDTPSNTWCRAPASTEGVAMIEYMMERIAYNLGKDPLQVRMLNYAKGDNPIPELINQLKKDANYDARIEEIKKFNDGNRWRKRALKIMPMTYEIFYLSPYNSVVSILHGDGSVILTHGGIEMGQGINTKVAQVCAYTLGIPLDKVSVKPSTSFTSPNNTVTGGSIGSECVAFATIKACEILMERLKPIKAKMNNPSWEQLVQQAFSENIDLQASYLNSFKDNLKPYDIYGIVALEVEVDILTGNHDVIRVDLLEDIGRSLSPEIDIGQIEGSFVMGLGYWTSEKLMYDTATGKLLTDRTWTYKPPGIKDIPADFRVYFRRNSSNPYGVLQSKATGEPAFCLAVVVTHAIREAVRAARLDAGYPDQWVEILDGKYGPDVSLNEFIRNVVDFRGTKAMCHEGGCGACVVAIRAPLPPNNEVKLFSVNSCLVSVLSCHGWEVTTVEGVGNRTMGYHDIQARLAKFNGTQCGYCTPGWIMNMYSLYESKNKNLSMKEIENSFASNICRCTGYRSIADAFKSFATDIDDRLKNKLIDLEDLGFVKPCGVNCKTKCQHKCDIKDSKPDENKETEDWFVVGETNKIVVDCGSTKFYKVFDLNDVFQAMEQGEYRLIAGNTGQGVFHVSNYPSTVIDIFNVAVLKEYTMDVNLILGAGMSLTEMMELFLKISGENEEFSYLKQFYDHMDLVAHIPVRNIGTIGGNLFIKHTHNDFQSDLFLLFETVGATLTIAEAPDKKQTVSLPDFLKLDMNRKLIMNVMLPPLSKLHSIKTYKIMPRSQNAHAVVNAGFLFHFKQNSNVLEKAFIVYGSISPKFIHAEKTEAMLAGKDPYTDETLQMVLKSLDKELMPEEAPPEPSARYRKMLALALYYKAILSLCPDDRLNPKYRSGAEVIKRHTSHGIQTFDTDKSVWPLNQPVPKLEALQQCSGEATFANDLTKQPDEVFAAFVTADARPGSVISGFDANDALKLEGVIAFYSAKDVPGNNSFTPARIPFIFVNEEILCSQKVLFYGQPAGIIVAVREKIANKAAKMVKVLYSSESKDKPILTASDVLKSPQKDERLTNNATKNPTDTGKDVDRVIYGDITLEGQYHYTMEPQTCVVKPTEDGMEVYSSSQWHDLTNVAIAQCLNISANKVNVIVRRVGGGYGSKITRQNQIACAAALVSHLQGKTCRFVMSIEDNMRIVGKRVPTYCNFEIGVNKEGEIQYLKNKFYQDSGCSPNEKLTPLTLNHFMNCYDSKRWYVEANTVATDTHSNTSCRAPWSTEGIAMIEHMMERIAYNLGKDPLQVRMLNYAKENPIPELIDQLKKDADYDERMTDIKKFNDSNRWRKRSLKLIPMTYDLNYLGPYNSVISILHSDGSIILTHGGIEMGQGINTKAAQVCAYTLGIPLDKVSVKPTTTFTSPNNLATGGSIGSECVAFAVIKACEILLERLKPIKAKMNNPSWEQLVQQAFLESVDLQASYLNTTKEIKPYEIYGVVVLEVEVDILTGNHDVIRVDLLEDIGRSLNPEIDVGQIEGAFVMGLGYWTSEKLMYDTDTGNLLTDRMWTYKPPGIKDIPADFRVYFRRNSRNPYGVLQSKATGEPALCLAVAVTHAIREAVRAARLDAGYPDQWVDISNPCTVENIFTAVGHKVEHFKLQ